LGLRPPHAPGVDQDFTLIQRSSTYNQAGALRMFLCIGQ